MASKATGPGSDDQFRHETPYGAVTVPSLAKLPMGLVRKSRKLSEADQVFTILEDLAADGALEILDQLDGAQFAEFMEAWSEHSGVSVGESTAS